MFDRVNSAVDVIVPLLYKSRMDVQNDTAAPDNATTPEDLPKTTQPDDVFSVVYFNEATPDKPQEAAVGLSPEDLRIYLKGAVTALTKAQRRRNGNALPGRPKVAYRVWNADCPLGFDVVGLNRAAQFLNLSLSGLFRARKGKRPFFDYGQLWKPPVGLHVYHLKEGCFTELESYENFLELKRLKAL